MESRNKLLKSLRLQPLLAKIAVGYMAKIVVISGIAYVGICEWKETKAREMEVRMINRKKHEINDIYVKMLRLSFFCETFMEWSEQDFLSFQKRRRHIDSLLCSLRYSSSGSHTDSIRNLWRAKERYMREIIYWVHRQEEADREIAAKIPAIARQSERENAPKGGFLKRLFAKRHRADSPSAASMLHELNRSVVGRQQAYARKLAERTDSLDGMNRRLNVQLRQMIENMDGTVQADLKRQEEEGAAADAVTFNENSENCYLDPRCEVLWFRPTPFDSLTTSPLPTENLKRDFNGVMNGETNVGGSYLNRYSANRCILSSDAMNKDYWWNLAREIVWMGYSESLFLKAEAALRWPSLVDETAEALYLKGIKASMDYYEIDADKANEYISHLDGVKAFAGGSKEEQLEQIITQKWIAVFPNGNEGWAEVRRTDYPRYLLAPVNGNNSNGEVASGKLIKRINYPNSESRNPNKPGNVNQGSRVWWDVADTMNDKGQWHTPNNFR